MTFSQAFAKALKAKSTDPQIDDSGGRRWRRLLVAAAVMATVGLVVGLLLSTSGSALSSGSERAAVGGSARVSSATPQCAKPSGTSVQSVRATGPSAQPATLLGGEAAGNAFLTALGEGALHWGEDEGLGWLLKTVTGEQGLDPAQIDEQFNTVNGKLDSLSQQQYDDCTAVLATLNAAETNDDVNTYDKLVHDMAPQVATIVTYEQDFDSIVSALRRNGGDFDALDPGYKDDLKDMISGGPLGLRFLINTINIQQVADSPGSKAMVLYFSQILSDQLGYDPYQTHIFPAAFVDGSSAQQGYYAALVDQAAYLYTNVEHLNFTDGSYTHKNNADSNADIVSLVNLAQADIHSWRTTFSDGPSGDWVSQDLQQGIGPIPADTVLDYRLRDQPLLWTASPVGLNGDPASPEPYYCASTAQFCYADRYTAAGQVGATSLVRPSPQPLADMIAADQHDDLSGWRAPTTADWNDLEAGATGGLTAWATAHQLEPFRSDSFLSHYAGRDQTLTGIAPVLVNTGTAGAPTYGVLSSADPKANTLTLEKTDLPDASQNAVAGRLFLVKDFQPTAAPQPFSTDQLNSRPPVTKTSKRSKASKTRTATASPRTVLGGSDPSAPATYSSPAACSATNTYVVPAGVGSVRITAVGGAGAAGTALNTATAPGGLGGSVTATYPVTTGDTLYIQVGGAGIGGVNQNGGNGRGGVGGGGNGGLTHSSYKGAGEYSGGGGGASGVSTTPDCSHWLIVGGGGGGGGAGHKANTSLSYDGGRGGDGCAPGSGSCTPAAAGGYLSPYVAEAGGAGGAEPDNHGGVAGSNAGAAGGTFQGGNGAESGSGGLAQGDGGGGGGGGGYFGGGGGGGGGHSAGGGGGGGGASFAIPGASDVSYGLGSSGQAGAVTITPIAKPQAPLSLSLQTTNLEWGQSDLLTATVPTDATGQILFHDNSSGDLGDAPIHNGVATLQVPGQRLKIGDHSILAAYFAGDAHYLTNKTAPTAVTVSKATPAMHLAVSGTDLQPGQTPTSLVVQMPSDATGSVGFSNDINGGCEGETGTGAACQNEGVATIINGYAILTSLTTPLPEGKNLLHASYSGDKHYQSSASNVVAVTLGP